MNRSEFMRQLEALLQNISPTEREEALQYYNEYFNDAGPENEQDVIAALGTPARVAENIKKDLYGSGYGDSTYERRHTGRNDVVEYRQAQASKEKEENKLPTGVIVLIVVLCILASPVLFGTGAGILGVVVGIVTTWFALILGFGAAAICLFIVLGVLVTTGIMCMFTGEVLVGIGLVGSGLICGGIGILLLMLTVAMAGIATPAICKGIGSLFSRLFEKKKTA